MKKLIFLCLAVLTTFASCKKDKETLVSYKSISYDVYFIDWGEVTYTKPNEQPTTVRVFRNFSTSFLIDSDVDFYGKITAKSLDKYLAVGDQFLPVEYDWDNDNQYVLYTWYDGQNNASTDTIESNRFNEFCEFYSYDQDYIEAFIGRGFNPTLNVNGQGTVVVQETP